MGPLDDILEELEYRHLTDDTMLWLRDAIIHRIEGYGDVPATQVTVERPMMEIGNVRVPTGTIDVFLHPANKHETQIWVEALLRHGFSLDWLVQEDK